MEKRTYVKVPWKQWLKDTLSQVCVISIRLDLWHAEIFLCVGIPRISLYYLPMDPEEEPYVQDIDQVHGIELGLDCKWDTEGDSASYEYSQNGFSGNVFIGKHRSGKKISFTFEGPYLNTPHEHDNLPWYNGEDNTEVVK